jgi:hypothetical protein
VRQLALATEEEDAELAALLEQNANALRARGSADRRGRAARARTSLDSGGRAHLLGEEKHDARDVLYHAGDPGIVTGFHHVRLAG